MDWSRKSVLITGAGGFIGSHLTEHLINLNANVKALVKSNSRNDWGLLEFLSKEKLGQVEIVMGDLRDSEFVQRAAKDIDVVFHLGSLISIPYSYDHPRETIDTNILGTLNVLSASRLEMVKKVVHTSTSEVYGTAKYVPIDELHPLQGQSPYSASKIGADKIAESFYRSFDLPVATIRPFNTYGPRQSARAIIPTIISQSLIEKKVLLGSLSPMRDYTYVNDTVNAFIKVAESPNTIGETINIGSNFEISIEELANRIISLIGKEIEIVLDPLRIRPKNSEVDRLWCNNSKAKELLDWNPKISLQEGLLRTIEWISNNPKIYKTYQYNR